MDVAELRLQARLLPRLEPFQQGTQRLGKGLLFGVPVELLRDRDRTGGQIRPPGAGRDFAHQVVRVECRHAVVLLGKKVDHARHAAVPCASSMTGMNPFGRREGADYFGCLWGLSRRYGFVRFNVMIFRQKRDTEDHGAIPSG